MTEQEIIEGNKLIMNSTFVADHHKAWIEKLIKFEGKPDTAYENAKYHSSWDWIMPVVEKIAAIEITPPPNYTWYRIEMVPSGYVKIEGGSLGKAFANVSKEGSFIAAVWVAVVDFIKHYNSLSNQTIYIIIKQ